MNYSFPLVVSWRKSICLILKLLTIPPHFEKHFDDLKSRTWRPMKALVTEEARGTAVYGAKRVRIDGAVLLYNIVQLAIVPNL